MNDFVSLKAQMNLASEPGMSHGMLDVDLKARRPPSLFAPRGSLDGVVRWPPRRLRPHQAVADDPGRHHMSPANSAGSLACGGPDTDA